MRTFNRKNYKLIDGVTKKEIEIGSTIKRHGRILTVIDFKPSSIATGKMLVKDAMLSANWISSYCFNCEVVEVKSLGAPKKKKTDVKENATVRVSKNQRKQIKQSGFKSLQDFLNKKLIDLKQTEILTKDE